MFYYNNFGKFPARTLSFGNSSITFRSKKPSDSLYRSAPSLILPLQRIKTARNEIFLEKGC